MLQTSLLLMKSLNKTETPVFLSVVCSMFPKAIFLTFILHAESLRLVRKKYESYILHTSAVMYFAKLKDSC